MSTTREALRIWRWHWVPLSVGIVLLILGLFFIVGGMYLITLGGTVHCLPVGCGLAATGLGLIAARGRSLRAYFIVLLGTLTCAVLQVGFERFGLAPRLWLPIALGIYLIMPWESHRFDDHWGAFCIGLVVVAGVVICRWPWFIPRGIHGTLTARGLTPAPTPLLAADANQYEERKTGDDIMVHAFPQDATAGPC